MQILERLNFTLYASMGTADFYSEHGIKVLQEYITIISISAISVNFIMILCVFRLRQLSGHLKTMGMGMGLRTVAMAHSRTLLTTCVSVRSA